MTITHGGLDLTIQGIPPDAYDLTVQGPPGPVPLLVTSGDQDWRPDQSCLLQPPNSADIWWLLKHIGLANEHKLSCLHVILCKI